MKQKRSMDEAIHAAKKLRREQASKPSGDTSQENEAHLKVVESALQGSSTENQSTKSQSAEQGTIQSPAVSVHQKAVVDNQRPVWVRHTVGLRDTTSLNLRDAAEAQKRKLRHGQLGSDEPANEQEIADLGIKLALRHLGYLT